MFNIFNSNVFVEIGEAIGNVGKKLSRRRSHADELEASFRRHLAAPLELHLPAPGADPPAPGDIVIEATFRVMDEEEEPR